MSDMLWTMLEWLALAERELLLFAGVWFLSEWGIRRQVSRIGAMVGELGSGNLAKWSVVSIGLFNSIMFPTIFALGVKDLGAQTKRAASFQVMSIIGGALMPAAMGWVADHPSTAIAYAMPAACFAVVLWYGLRGHRVATH
mgnify:CR=1 FL=1